MGEREKQGEEQAECRARCGAESQDPRSCLAPKPRVGHPIDWATQAPLTNLEDNIASKDLGSTRCVCVCVCVCDKETEQTRERGRRYILIQEN